MKTQAAGVVSRGEWEQTVHILAIDEAALAPTPVKGIADQGRLSFIPVFETTVERHTWDAGSDHSRIELSIDRGELESNGRREPILECEIELKDGPVATLFGEARRLAATAPLYLSLESKAERGFKLADQTSDDARRGTVALLAPSMSTAEGFQRIAIAALNQMTANANLLRHARRPETIHQLRVGIRRLRTAIRLFDAVLVDDERARLDDALDWLAGKMDSARDLDVLVGATFRTTVGAPGDEGMAALGRHLRSAKHQAYARAVAAVKSARYRALALDLAAWIETGAWMRTAEFSAAVLREAPISKAGAKALDVLNRGVRSRGRELERLDPHLRHKLRIKAKRLRYAAEFLAHLYPHRRRGRQFIERLRALQDALGELNDIAVARERLVDQAGPMDPPIAFAAGRMVGWRERDEPRLLRDAVTCFQAFEDVEPFWK